MYFDNFKKCHLKIVDTFQYVSKNYKSGVFETYPLDEYSTNFIMVNNNNIRLSISHPIDTDGELETIIYEGDELNHDSLEYHENHEKLLEYIKDLK